MASIGNQIFGGNVVDLYNDKELYKLYNEFGRKTFVSKILKAGMSVPEAMDHPNTHKSFWYAKNDKPIKNIGFKSVSEVKRGTASDKVFKNKAIFDNTLPETSFFIEAIK